MKSMYVYCSNYQSKTTTFSGGDTIRLYSSNEVATNSNTTASQCTSLAGYNCLAKASCHPEVLTIVTLTNTKTWITNYLA